MQAEQVGRASLGGLATDRPAEGTLTTAVNGLNRRIRDLEERLAMTYGGLERLINPRPVNATRENNAKIARDPITIEDKLNDIQRRLDTLLEMADDQLNRINSAV